MSVFGIHDKTIRDNELRQAGTPPAPADRQIARTRLFYNDKGQVSKVLKFTSTTIISQTEFTYDNDHNGRLKETWNPLTHTRKVMVYDPVTGRLEDTITYRVAD